MLPRPRPDFTGEPDAAKSCPSGSEGAERRRTPAMEQRAALRPYLHGLETAISKRFPRSNSRGFNPPNGIKYGDDFVVLQADLDIIKQGQAITTDWLKEVGLELKPGKTRITPSLTVAAGKPGFDFLGFNIRQYPVGKTKSGKDGRGRLDGFKTHLKPSKEAIEKHVTKLRETFRQYRHAPQAALINGLNPIGIGWSNYYAYGVSAQVFKYLDKVVYSMLGGWATYRHPQKSKDWIAHKYWRIDDGQGWVFRPPAGGWSLARQAKPSIKRYIKVQGRRSL